MSWIEDELERATNAVSDTRIAAQHASCQHALFAEPDAGDAPLDARAACRPGLCSRTRFSQLPLRSLRSLHTLPASYVGLEPVSSSPGDELPAADERRWL
jgi:hypothetical protein